ncbi:hypothetical protein LC55x_0414 [Lysobacter capsici]|nr:hypothetical protein LC55x_0414 [Lysobacter capsici]
MGLWQSLQVTIGGVPVGRQFAHNLLPSRSPAMKRGRRQPAQFSALPNR